MNWKLQTIVATGLYFNDNVKLVVMKRMCLTIIAAFTGMLALAQEKGADIDVNINKDGGGSSFWGSPVMWIVGAAVFIILLVAVSRGSSRQS